MGVCIETLIVAELCLVLTVTPYMGVCIETLLCLVHKCLSSVTPYMGVCIETLVMVIQQKIVMSHPIWVCVLKHVHLHIRPA